MTAPSPTLVEHHKRVIEDAYELVAALEIVRPLTGPTFVRLQRAGNWEVPIALRRLLVRSVVLSMLRLMDASKTGGTGKTAGILALLEIATAEGGLSSDQSDQFRLALKGVRDDFAAGNFPFSEVVRLRNAHIGHSLIPHKPFSNQLAAHELYPRVEALLRLVSDIETQLKRNGMEFPPPSMEKRRDWRRRSSAFWRVAVRSMPHGKSKRTSVADR